MAAKRNYIIGVDTGGTFTDVVVLADTGEVWTAKASTTPDDFSRGVMDAVGITRDLGADHAGRVAVVLRPVHPADAVAVEQLHVERTGRRAVVRAGRMADSYLGWLDAGMLVHGTYLTGNVFSV